MPAQAHSPAQFMELPVTNIIVRRDDRQRREIKTDGLIDSIRKHGVLQPVIVDYLIDVEGRGAPDGPDGWLLIAGERRLAASIELGLATIPARLLLQLSSVERQIIELEENIKRTDLDWPDLVRAVGRIHQLYLEIDEEWTLGETAEGCSLTAGTVSMYLKVFRSMEDEKIAGAGTVREAYNMLDRRDQRAAGDALQEILDTTNDVMPATSGEVGLTVVGGSALPRVGPEPQLPGPRYAPVESTILHETFMHWAPKYTGRKFNLVHCDFPYGIGLFQGPQAGGARHDSAYDDTKDEYFDLLECLCRNLDRLMAVSGHLMFWYSEKHGAQTRQMFRELAPSLAFSPFPLVWIKSDNAGIASDPRHGPRHIYETCLFASRGGRQIIRVASDAYSSPTDKRFHVSTKPEPMLKHFMSMTVDDNTWLLDPTCGSASALRAAEELGAARCLGMDTDERTVGVARVALRTARTLRTASRELV